MKLSRSRCVAIVSVLSLVVSDSLGDLSSMSGSIVFSRADVEPPFGPALIENPPPTAGVPEHFLFETLCIVFWRRLAG